MQQRNDPLESISRTVSSHFDEALQDLCSLLAIPSVATTGRAMDEAAATIQQALESLGAGVRLAPTDGYPAVIGHLPGRAARPGESLPTILIYGHYDVQPEDPVELWTSPPFKPTIRDGLLYGRGATDDKGNLMAAIWGVKTLCELDLPRPNVTFCFEGEEEIGSPHLGQVLRENKDDLAADACVLFDRGIHENGAAQLYLGNKGMVHVELKLTGAVRDVHSSQAHLLPNPARQLMEIVRELATPAGRLNQPDLVRLARPATPAERELVKTVPVSLERFAASYGLPVDRLHAGERTDPIALVEQMLFQPTANVQGFHSGYGGPGNKTIVPSTAAAKLDVRLSPGMDCQDTADALTRVIQSRAAQMGLGEALEVTVSGEMQPYAAPPSHPVVKAAIKAGRDVYPGDPVVWPLVDGSGPLGSFAETINNPAILVGLGNPFETANTHAPDENIGIETYQRGINMVANFLTNYVAQA